jgi:hypothetical protein
MTPGMDNIVRHRDVKRRTHPTITREFLAAVIADLEESLTQCLAELPPGPPAADDYWHQAKVAFGQFLAAWIKYEEANLAAVVKDPPAVC